MEHLDFKHHFIPSPSLQQHNTIRFKYKEQTTNDDKSETLTLLLLHGTGGNEDDLITNWPNVIIFCISIEPSWKSTGNGMSRFYKRLAEGVFDMEDLKLRTKELAVLLKMPQK